MVGLKCWGHTASLCPLAPTTKVCSSFCVCLRCPPPSFVHPHVCVGVGGGTQVFVWVSNGGKPSAHLMSAGSVRENKKTKNGKAHSSQTQTDESFYKGDTLLIVLNLCITSFTLVNTIGNRNTWLLGKPKRKRKKTVFKLKHAALKLLFSKPAVTFWKWIQLFFLF